MTYLSSAISFSRKLPALALGISTFMLSACAALQQGADSQNPMVVYISGTGGQKDVYISDLQGKNPRALTQDVAEDAHPRLTLDGRVVFASKRTGTWQVYIMNRDGSDVRALTTERGVNNYRPFPSPDGRVVFVSDRYLKPQIFSINADGSDLRRLSEGDFHNDYPVVADDGHIYYTTSRGSKWDIWKMAPDGTRQRQVTRVPMNVQEIAVVPPMYKDYAERFTNRSPMIPFYSFQTENRLVFSALTDTGALGIFRVDEDGSNLQNLSQPGMYISRSPVLMPNGQVLFTSDRNGSTDVWTMYPDGKIPRQVVKEAAYESTS